MFDRQVNPRRQGDAGLGIAIGWFACNDYTVCIPLTDSQRFDLVVSPGDGSLLRVQVKTTTSKDKYGRYRVHLRTNGGNRSGTGRVTHFDPQECDLLFVVTGEGGRYLLPAAEVSVRAVLVLGDRCKQYLLQ